MCPQSVFTRECILALVAFVWFFSTVRFQMCPQNVCPRGAIVALVHFQFNLRAHLKTHGGEKSNKCHQCNYGSSWADVLRTHLKTHSGEKSNNHCILWPLINHMVWHNGIFLNFLEHLKIHGSIWDFTGASVILLERLRASVGFRNFDGASEIFRSVCGISGTKKMPPWKNAPFSLHIQDRGEQDAFKDSFKGI